MATSQAIEEKNPYTVLQLYQAFIFLREAVRNVFQGSIIADILDNSSNFTYTSDIARFICKKMKIPQFDDEWNYIDEIVIA